MIGERFEEYRRELRRLRGVRVSASGSSTISVGGLVVKVSGSARVSEEELRVSGSGRVDGSLSVDRVSVSGSFTCGGDLEARELRASGSCSVHGTVVADTVSVSGSCRVGGDLRASTVSASGSLSVSGNISGDCVRVSGSLRASKVEAGDCELSGAFRARAISCERVFRARLGGLSSVEEIRAGEVDVRRETRVGRGGFRLVLFNVTVISVGGAEPEGRLTAKRIVGEERVYLENTECDLVRGRVVELGPGCRVKRVEYVESYSVDPSSQVVEGAFRVGSVEGRGGGG